MRCLSGVVWVSLHAANIWCSSEFIQALLANLSSALPLISMTSVTASASPLNLSWPSPIRIRITSYSFLSRDTSLKAAVIP